MSKTEDLLRKWIETAPQRAAETARLLREEGMEDDEIEAELKIKVGKPEAPLQDIPTFDPKVTRPLSPMLQDRFKLAGPINDAGEKWLSLKDMRKAMSSGKVLKHFKSHKEHWENSAPALFAPSQLALFAVEQDAEENQTYLVWPSDKIIEPKIYRYFDRTEHIFENLNAFLEWACSG